MTEWEANCKDLLSSSKRDGRPWKQTTPKNCFGPYFWNMWPYVDIWQWMFQILYAISQFRCVSSDLCNDSLVIGVSSMHANHIISAKQLIHTSTHWETLNLSNLIRCQWLLICWWSCEYNHQWFRLNICEHQYFPYIIEWRMSLARWELVGVGSHPHLFGGSKPVEEAFIFWWNSIFQIYNFGVKSLKDNENETHMDQPIKKYQFH